MNTRGTFGIGYVGASATLLLAVAACTSAPATESDSVPAGDAKPTSPNDATKAESSSDQMDQTFTLTIVSQNDDGSVNVKTRPITLAEQIRNRELEAEREEARAKGITVLETRGGGPWSGGCASTDLDLFSQTNYTGNELCMSGTINYDLSTFVYGPVCSGTGYDTNIFWFDYNAYAFQSTPVPGCYHAIDKSSRVRSLKTGDHRAAFRSTWGIPLGCVVTYGAYTNVPSFVDVNANNVDRGNTYCL